MNTKTEPGISDQELTALENQVTALIDSCAHLKQENRALRSSNDELQAERVQLLGNNEHARTRVDAMITRLKSMEENT